MSKLDFINTFTNKNNIEGELDLTVNKRGAKIGNGNSKGPRLHYHTTVEEGKQFESPKHFLKYKRERLTKQNERVTNEREKSKG